MMDPLVAAFYHGTPADLAEGDLVEPGREPNWPATRRDPGHAYFTDSENAARDWAHEVATRQWARGGYQGPREAIPEHVYEVEPTGEHESDPHLQTYDNPDYSRRSRHPLRVVRKVSAIEGYPNPYHGTEQFGGNPEFAHTWFHGTKGEPSLGERQQSWSDQQRMSKPFEERLKGMAWSQPNKYMGIHFSPLHEVGRKFAGQLSDTGGAIVHARLNFRNPAHFPTERHLNYAVAHWASQHYPHWHDEGVNGQMRWNYSDAEGTHRDFSKVPEGYGDKAQDVLQWHPHLPEIIRGFHQHLRDTGHHGITYGNMVEGPYSTDAAAGGQRAMKYIEKTHGRTHDTPYHVSAIALPEQVQTTHVEHIAPWKTDPEPHQRTWAQAGEHDEPDEMRDKILAFHREHPAAYPGRMHHEGALKVHDYEGETGNPDHITRNESGMVPIDWVRDLAGKNGEYPDVSPWHKRGQEWEDFKGAVARGEGGAGSPIFVTVDHGDEPKIVEGNQRRDAYAELGRSHVPAEIRYFGHAERQGTLEQRARRHQAAAETRFYHGIMDPRKLVPTEDVARSHWHEPGPFRDYLDQVKADVAKYGQQTPIDVDYERRGRDRNPRPYIGQGHHRWKVMTELGLPAQVSAASAHGVPEGMTEAREITREEHNQHLNGWKWGRDSDDEYLRSLRHQAALREPAPEEFSHTVYPGSTSDFRMHGDKYILDHNLPRSITAYRVGRELVAPNQPNYSTGHAQPKAIGYLHWHQAHEDRPPEIGSIWVHEKHRGRGVAAAMLEHAREIEPGLQHSRALTPEGRAWSEKHASSGERYVTCDQGHTHWGAHGAAGLLIRHRGQDGQTRYLLQKRAPWVDHGSTWSIPGGALHKDENSYAGAKREAAEEIGRLPRMRRSHTVTDDHGGWAYHTHVTDVDEPFQPDRHSATTGDETWGTGWFTSDEVKDLDLHPGFAKTWDTVRRSRSDKTAALDYSSGVTPNGRYDPSEPVYVRFGDWHPSERSVNHITGHPEMGVSVYDLDQHGHPKDPDPNFERDPEEYEHLGGMNDTAEDLQLRIDRAERDRNRGLDDRHNIAHLVQGEHIGFGSDWEPLLRNVRRVGDWIDHRHHFIPGARPHRFAGMYGDVHEHAENMPHEAKAKKPTKTKAQVNYREAGKDARERCGNCVMIRMNPPDFESFGCTLVKGLIEEDHVCDEWYPDKKHEAATYPTDHNPRYEEAELPNLYHGTNQALNTGDHIRPGHETNFPGAYESDEYLERVHATPSRHKAWYYADNAVHEHGGSHHVYQVEPTGPVTWGDEAFPEDYSSDLAMQHKAPRMSEHSFRVVREIPYRGEELPFTRRRQASFEDASEESRARRMQRARDWLDRRPRVPARLHPDSLNVPDKYGEYNPERIREIMFRHDPGDVHWHHVPEENVDLRQKIVYHQPTVDRSIMHQKLNEHDPKHESDDDIWDFGDPHDEHDPPEEPLFIRHHNVMHLVDGTHRFMRARLLGQTHMWGRVFDVGKPSEHPDRCYECKEHQKYCGMCGGDEDYGDDEDESSGHTAAIEGHGLDPFAMAMHGLTGEDARDMRDVLDHIRRGAPQSEPINAKDAEVMARSMRGRDRMEQAGYQISAHSKESRYPRGFGIDIHHGHTMHLVPERHGNETNWFARIDHYKWPMAPRLQYTIRTKDEDLPSAVHTFLNAPEREGEMRHQREEGQRIHEELRREGALNPLVSAFMESTAGRGYELGPRSGMISLDLPHDISNKIAVPGGVEDHHVTLVYLGKDVSDAKFEEACRRAREGAARIHGPVPLLLKELGSFEPSESSDGMRPAIIHTRTSPALYALRDDLADMSESEFKDWKPHVTLAYVDEDEEMPEFEGPLHTAITHISVHRGDQVRRYPFG